MSDYTKYDGHTPGPWEVVETGRSSRPPFIRRSHVGLAVAKITRQGKTNREIDADAALIADAPALLARVAALEVERDRLRADRDHLHRVMGRLVYFHETNDTANSDPWVDAKMALAGKHLPAIRAALAGGAA